MGEDCSIPRQVPYSPDEPSTQQGPVKLFFYVLGGSQVLRDSRRIEFQGMIPLVFISQAGIGSKFSAGVVLGALSGLLATPFDLVRIRLEAKTRSDVG